MKNDNLKFKIIRRKRYSLLQSFSFAIKGIVEAVKKERNLKIELVFALLIALIGVFLNFNFYAWLIILILTALVLSAEIFNSSIENICNLLNEKLKLEYKETKQIRDTAAGAVFLIACFAALIGLLIILQRL